MAAGVPTSRHVGHAAAVARALGLACKVLSWWEVGPRCRTADSWPGWRRRWDAPCGARVAEKGCRSAAWVGGRRGLAPLPAARVPPAPTCRGSASAGAACSIGAQALCGPGTRRHRRPRYRGGGRAVAKPPTAPRGGAAPGRRLCWGRAGRLRRRLFLWAFCDPPRTPHRPIAAPAAGSGRSVAGLRQLPCDGERWARAGRCVAGRARGRATGGRHDGWRHAGRRPAPGAR